MVSVKDHLPAIGSDPLQELPAGGSHGSQASRKLGFSIQLAHLSAEEVTDFQNRMDAGETGLLAHREHRAHGLSGAIPSVKEHGYLPEMEASDTEWFQN